LRVGSRRGQISICVSDLYFDCDCIFTVSIYSVTLFIIIINYFWFCGWIYFYSVWIWRVNTGCVNWRNLQSTYISILISFAPDRVEIMRYIYVSSYQIYYLQYCSYQLPNTILWLCVRMSIMMEKHFQYINILCILFTKAYFSFDKHRKVIISAGQSGYEFGYESCQQKLFLWSKSYNLDSINIVFTFQETVYW